jgi:hypothetical protein
MNRLKVLVGTRATSWILVASVAGLAMQPVLAQTPASPRPAQPAPAILPQPAAPHPQGAPVILQSQPQVAAPLAPAPAPLPPVIWDVASAQELLAYIEQLGAEGLNPSD